jgi:hypothetical protein
MPHYSPPFDELHRNKMGIGTMTLITHSYSDKLGGSKYVGMATVLV